MRRIRVVLDLIPKAARIVSPDRELTATHDPADNRFLECAEALKADYLVTGNKRPFPTEERKPQVVNARELLQWTIPELR